MSNKPISEEPPKGVAPYVRALGRAEACAFLLRFGGQIINIPAKPRDTSPLVQEIGLEASEAMRGEFGNGALKVPMGRSWIARQLAADGVARAEIAKRLRVTRESVRLYLAPRKAGGP